MKKERVKILYQHMTDEEKLLLQEKLHKIHIRRFVEHSLNRMSQKSIKKCEVMQVLSDYEIIELNYRMDSEKRKPRVLLRGNQTDQNGNVTCVVIELGKYGEVVTVYKNKRWDNHKQLIFDNYKEVYIKNLVTLVLS